MTVAKYFKTSLRPGLIRGEMPDWLRRHPRNSYIIAAILSCPEWADRGAIEALRIEARRLTHEFGTLYVLDHIIPMSHPQVCGLSVLENLRVVPWAVNASKGNSWNPNQMELL